MKSAKNLQGLDPNLLDKPLESRELLPQPSQLSKSISRKEATGLREKIPRSVKKIIKFLRTGGYKAYLVGGCVRDLLLGLIPKDFDIVTDARPEELLTLFPNSRLIGRRFPIVHIYITKNFFVEVSTFRGREEEDTKNKDNYGTPKEDAKRRDLTINALFYDPFEDEIIDYVGGLEDLKKGIIRIIGKPAERYERDPVRMLRVIRHTAKTGFNIDSKTWEDLLIKKGLIKIVPKERLRDEILKDITGSWTLEWYKLCKESGLLFEIYPFFQELIKNPLFQEKILLELLKYISREDFSSEQKVVLFAYAFLPLIGKPYDPSELKEMPPFERDELLRLFWSLFFTFRFNRPFFEKTMDMLRDLYKLLYLTLKKKEIPKKFKKKFYFFELLPLIEILQRRILKQNKVGGPSEYKRNP